MTLWVDADACPVVIKEILFRASERTQLPLVLVANRPIHIPRSKLVSMVQVGAGMDVADNEIVRRLSPGDVVITQDIPLAAEVIEKGGHALSPRGELFTPDNIRDRLSVRGRVSGTERLWFASGVETGGPPALGLADRQNFANKLDALLTRLLRGG